MKSRYLGQMHAAFSYEFGNRSYPKCFRRFFSHSISLLPHFAIFLFHLLWFQSQKFRRNIISCARHAVAIFSNIIHDCALATAALAVSLDNTLSAHIKIKIIFNFFPLLWLCLAFSFGFFLVSACCAVDEAYFFPFRLTLFLHGFRLTRLFLHFFSIFFFIYIAHLFRCA